MIRIFEVNHNVNFKTLEKYRKIWLMENGGKESNKITKSVKIIIQNKILERENFRAN